MFVRQNERKKIEIYKERGNEVETLVGVEEPTLVGRSESTKRR